MNKIVFSMLFLSIGTHAFAGEHSLKKLSPQVLLKAFQNHIPDPENQSTQGYLKILIGCGHEPKVGSFCQNPAYYPGLPVQNTPSYTKAHQHNSYLTINQFRSDYNTIHNFYPDIVADGVSFLYTLAQNPLYKGRLSRIFFERINLDRIPVFCNNTYHAEGIIQAQKHSAQNKEEFIKSVAFLLHEKGQVLHHSYADHAASFANPETRIKGVQNNTLSVLGSDHVFFGGLIPPLAINCLSKGLVQILGRMAPPLGGSADRLFDPIFIEQTQKHFEKYKKIYLKENLPERESHLAYCFRTRMPLYGFEKCSRNLITQKQNTFEDIQNIPSFQEHFEKMGLEGFLDTAKFCDLKLLSEIFSFPPVQAEKAQCLKIVLDRLTSLIQNQEVHPSWQKKRDIFKKHFDTLVRYYDQFCDQENPHPQHILTPPMLQFLKRNIGSESPDFEGKVVLEQLWSKLMQSKLYLQDRASKGFADSVQEQEILCFLSKFQPEDLEFIFKQSLKNLSKPHVQERISLLLQEPTILPHLITEWKQTSFLVGLTLKGSAQALEKIGFFKSWFQSDEEMTVFLTDISQGLVEQDHALLGSKYWDWIQTHEKIKALVCHTDEFNALQEKKEQWKQEIVKRAAQTIKSFILEKNGKNSNKKNILTDYET
jgi:hypothetical protein